MKQDKFLLSIVGGTLALVIVAIATALVARLQPPTIPDDTPEGVTYNYFLAMEQGDYRKAYDYLTARVKARVKNPAFPFRNPRPVPSSDTRLRVDETVITGDSARLKVTLFVSSSGGLFGVRSEYSQPDVVWLVREDGAWKIDRFPFPYWDTDWK